MAAIAIVAGARPNFVKVAPLLRALETGADRALLVHTGQHYDYQMSGVFFRELGIRDPDVHLEVRSGGHAVQTARIMIAFDEYLACNDVAAVVVVGDVNSTLACALVAAKRHVPVVHVEAGLRSFDREMPEEHNRVVTDALSDVLFVSEPAGLVNLAREGVPEARVRYAGNVMIDTLVDQLGAARALDVAARWQLGRERYAVVTLHRPSNVDQAASLSAMVELLAAVAAHVPIVFPVHPRTEARLAEFGLVERLRSIPRLHVATPLGYREFLGLVAGAALVLTDSGGIQEETTYLDVPCITLRASTERPVTLELGTNVLVGDDRERALGEVRRVLGGDRKHATPIRGWDGKAAQRVVEELRRVF